MEADERGKISRYNLCPRNRKRVAQESWQMGRRGKGEKAQRGRGTQAPWPQIAARGPWPAGFSLGPVLKFQLCMLPSRSMPVMCQLRLSREMGHMAAYGAEARKCTGLAVHLAQEHKGW